MNDLWHVAADTEEESGLGTEEYFWLIRPKRSSGRGKIIKTFLGVLQWIKSSKLRKLIHQLITMGARGGCWSTLAKEWKGPRNLPHISQVPFKVGWEKGKVGTKWLTCVFTGIWSSSLVLKDSTRWILPVYKGKGSHWDCQNYRSITYFSSRQGLCWHLPIKG